MGGGDLRAVGVVVDSVQRVQEAPDARAEEGQRGRAKRPEQRRLVGVVAAALPDHDEGEGHHPEEGHDFERREHRPDPLPVTRHTDPVIVVAGAQNAREQRRGDDHVEPFFHDLAVDPGELEHQEAKDRGHHQFPGAFDPEVNDIPPVLLVEREVAGVVEGEEEQQGDAPEAEQQDVGDRGLAAFEHRQRDVVEEDQRRNDDAHLHPARLFDKLAAFIAEQEIAVEQVERIGHHHAGSADDQDRELEIGQLGRMDLALAFFGHEVIGGPEKAGEQPHDEAVCMQHPGNVERQDLGEEVAVDVDPAKDQAHRDLDGEENHRRQEIGIGDFLSLVFHGALLLSRHHSAASPACGSCRSTAGSPRARDIRLRSG